MFLHRYQTCWQTKGIRETFRCEKERPREINEARDVYSIISENNFALSLHNYRIAKTNKYKNSRFSRTHEEFHLLCAREQ
jgi:hypothetical protein